LKPALRSPTGDDVILGLDVEDRVERANGFSLDPWRWRLQIAYLSSKGGSFELLLRADNGLTTAADPGRF
jgi:hypothetical protein